MELPVYLDHAATTPVAPDVLQDMLPYFTEVYANAATLYAAGFHAREAVEAARAEVARAISADPEEICFTSGGTEADNWALRGAARAARSASGRRHLLVSAIEHHAVLETALGLRDDGFDVDVVPVDAEGLVEPRDVALRIRGDTVVVSVMHANNEVGSVQPIAQIGAICRERGVMFHVDAVQSFGKIPIDVSALSCDLLSLSAHKVYGPKGVGGLYVRRGVRLDPLLTGGGQERGRRAGTLNVAGIVGLGSAARRAVGRLPEESRRLADLRDRLIEDILSAIPDARICGPREPRLPNNVHCCVPGVEGESLLLALDAAGVCASAGAACTTGSPEPSHVLRAMGVPLEDARGAVRLTLGESTTPEAVDYAAERLAEAAAELRALAA